ncbi:MAG TPA: L,D-transpeptidase family protein [Sphingomicrobium sp.]
MSISNFKSFAFASAAALVAPGAAVAADQAAVPVAASQAIALPSAGSVAAIYNQYKMKPIWFRNGAPTVAATQLVQILRRSPLDGLGSGPQLADQIEAAMRSANGNPAAIDAAEQLMSSSWVLYVQTIKRPTPGMIYQYDVLKPQGSRTDQILLGAAAAPSLEAHISSVAAVNPIYSGIRNAEWARMQASGSPAPDPKILANLERARSIPARGKFVLVDVASQRLFMYENGAPVDSMKVIVGDQKLPTPMIASVMYYIAYNPYWNAPDHLVKGPIAAKTLAGGKKYFDSMGYQVMADWTANSATVPFESVNWKDVAAGKTHVRVRQDPGPKNFMAQLKYPFANPQDIYLHDTPEKGPFSLANRARSNGCVRLEDAQRFGRWLLGSEPNPPGTTPEIQVQLPRGVPIYITYLTAQPTSDGKIAWVKDEYGWDQPGAQVASTYISPAARAAN